MKKLVGFYDFIYTTKVNYASKKVIIRNEKCLENLLFFVLFIFLLIWWEFLVSYILYLKNKEYTIIF